MKIDVAQAHAVMLLAKFDHCLCTVWAHAYRLRLGCAGLAGRAGVKINVQQGVQRLWNKGIIEENVAAMPISVWHAPRHRVLAK
jgi:hypothetical protein